MSKARKHYFMVSALVVYIREDSPKQKHMNCILQINSKDLNYDALKGAELSIKQRLETEQGVVGKDVKDIHFLNIFPMGYMTEAEFQGGSVQHG